MLQKYDAKTTGVITLLVFSHQEPAGKIKARKISSYRYLCAVFQQKIIVKYCSWRTI